MVFNEETEAAKVQARNHGCGVTRNKAAGFNIKEGGMGGIGCQNPPLVWRGERLNQIRKVTFSKGSFASLDLLNKTCSSTLVFRQCFRSV